jgi:DNA-binding transcriptional regulator YiaG
MNAEYIQRLRSRLGLSQEQFAKRLNVSVRTIKRWEANESAPHPVFIKAMQELR